MGFHLEGAAWAIWSELPDRPFRVLLFIARSLPDPDPGEPIPDWYGNPDRLAVAIGQLDQVDGKQRRTVLNKISRAMTALVDAGALTVISRASPGNRARYGVQLSMERSRYGRDRSNGLRRSNFHGQMMHTFTAAPCTKETSKRNPLRPALGSDALGSDGVDSAGVELAEVARAKFRTIDGGGADDDPDRTEQLQWPLFAVPDAAEPVQSEWWNNLHDPESEAL